MPIALRARALGKHQSKYVPKSSPRFTLLFSPCQSLFLISRNVAGVPVRVMVAPVVPGLTDHEAPAIFNAYLHTDARYVLLRLPQTVEPVFFEWLRGTQPLKSARVESLVRRTWSGLRLRPANGRQR